MIVRAGDGVEDAIENKETVGIWSVCSLKVRN